MDIIAKCGTIIKVSKSHHLLNEGVFRLLCLKRNTGLELDFLNFVFFGQTLSPILHAKMACNHGLEELARETFLKHIDEIENLCEEMENLFAWYELPDKFAVDILKQPTYEDFCDIVRLGYVLCYRKFVQYMYSSNYKSIHPNIVREMINALGVFESIEVCCANGHIGLVRYLISTSAKRKHPLFIITKQRLVNIVRSVTFGFMSSSYDPKTSQDNEITDEMVRYLKFYGVLSVLFYKNDVCAFFMHDHIGGPKFVADSALIFAAAYGHIEIVKFLVSAGVCIKSHDNLAVKLAARQGHLPMVKYLVSIGANVRADDDYAFMYAAQNGFLKTVKYLVSVGANIKAKKDSVLFLADLNGHSKVVEYLVSLRGNSSPAIELEKYYTCLHANNEAMNYLRSLGIRV